MMKWNYKYVGTFIYVCMYMLRFVVATTLSKNQNHTRKIVCLNMQMCENVNIWLNRMSTRKIGAKKKHQTNKKQSEMLLWRTNIDFVS